MENEIVAALVTTRVTLLIAIEDAPFGIMAAIRARLGQSVDSYGQIQNNNELAKLISCPWCLSVWVGVVVALLLGFPWYHGLAYSAVTIGLWEYVGNR